MLGNTPVHTGCPSFWHVVASMPLLMLKSVFIIPVSTTMPIPSVPTGCSSLCFPPGAPASLLRLVTTGNLLHLYTPCSCSTKGSARPAPAENHVLEYGNGHLQVFLLLRPIIQTQPCKGSPALVVVEVIKEGSGGRHVGFCACSNVLDPKLLADPPFDRSLPRKLRKEGGGWDGGMERGREVSEDGQDVGMSQQPVVLKMPVIGL